VTYPVTDVPKTGSKETKKRAVKVPAFGAVLKQARGAQSLPMVKIKTGISTSYVYQLEQGTTEAPDPVKLMKLAEYYGLDFVKLVNLLRWNREEYMELLERRAGGGAAAKKATF
jgi:transcriptional regulator with XRE-family HTH domain